MRKTLLAVSLLSVVLLLATPGRSQTGDGSSQAIARLRAFEEVPALSTPGGGQFTATISADESEITYELHYFNLRGHVTQSHIHLGQRGVNGGITIFLCSNLGNGPVGTQTCPASPATITGTIHASDVTAGAAAQGLAAGQLPSILRAIRAGVAYANLHTDLFPGGEIRGQIIFIPATTTP
jgi:CHRD domain-containing protein